MLTRSQVCRLCSARFFVPILPLNIRHGDERGSIVGDSMRPAGRGGAAGAAMGAERGRGDSGSNGYNGSLVEAATVAAMAQRFIAELGGESGS